MVNEIKTCKLSKKGRSFGGKSADFLTQMSVCILLKISCIPAKKYGSLFETFTVQACRRNFSVLIDTMTSIRAGNVITTAANYISGRII